MQKPEAKEERLTAFAEASRRRVAALREVFGISFISPEAEEKPREPATDLSDAAVVQEHMKV